MSNFNVPESAIQALEEHTSSSDGPSNGDIERVADFIANIITGIGKMSQDAVRAADLHAEYITEALEDEAIFSDETNAAWVGRLAIDDPERAGVVIQSLSREAVRRIADQHFDEFADAARNMGWIE